MIVKIDTNVPFKCTSWESGQVLSRKLMLGLVADFQQNKPLALNSQFVHGMRSILSDTSLDKVMFLSPLPVFIMFLK